MSTTVEAFTDEETWGWDYIRPGSDEGQIWFYDIAYDGEHGVVVAVAQTTGDDMAALEALIASVGEDLDFYALPRGAQKAVLAAGGVAE